MTFCVTLELPMFFFPKLVATQKSPFNGEIKVYQQFGKYSLSVDNLTQSGGLLNSIWKKALKLTTNYQLLATNCLILGLGGGTAAKWIRCYYPKAKITAIEIDPVMITLAKKYGYTKNVHIITADAFKAIYQLPATSYSLILVDTYQGKNYPQSAKSLRTARQLKRLLTKPGFVIFNRLNWGEFGQDTQKQITMLEKIFPKVDSKKILSNTLVFCHKKR